MGNSAFQALREPGRPSLHGENKWPVTADTVIYGILYCFLALAFSFYVTLIGVRGIERLYAFTRITVSLFIGAVILVCNFGYGWEYGSVHGVMQYKAFSKNYINAELGLKVGLRGINITLMGIPREQFNQTINYNERFSWEWVQGKPGYGTQAGKINRQYRAAQIKGLPYPILWTVEYFTIDGANFRHGRYYRTAGWFCHITLWVAFPIWILSNILFFMVIRFGAYYLALTGGCLLLTNVLFASIRNSVPVTLHFDSQPLSLSYGWCFWLVLFTGLMCVILAAVILFMDLRYPEELSTLFGVDVLQDYEDFYADPVDLGLVPPIVTSEPSSSVLRDTSVRTSQEVYSIRKRTMSTRFQRSLERPVPAPRNKISKDQGSKASELPVYENLNLKRFDPIGEEDEPKDGSQEKIIMREM